MSAAVESSDVVEELSAVASEVNAKLAELGIADVAHVVLHIPKYSWDEHRLQMGISGEIWGYSLLEYRGGVYVTQAVSPMGARRWKRRSTAVDRLTKHIARTVELRRTSRSRLERQQYLGELLSKVEGLELSISSNWLRVTGTDCQLEVHHDSISVASRNAGIYLSIQAPADGLDMLVTSAAEVVVREMRRIKEARDTAEANLKQEIKTP